jgi:outer membrane protein assembly factor BamB
MAKKSNMVMQVQINDGKWSVSPKWKTAEAAPSWASPMAYKGCAYWVNRSGLIYCFDLETGELNYKERTKQSCWATPVGIGEHVYFFGKDGLTSVIAAGKEFKLLAENETWDPNSIVPDTKAGEKEPTEERRRAAASFSGPTQYGCAIANGRIVVRTGDTVYCIGQ